MPEAHPGSVLRYALATASFGAGLIHARAVIDHRDHEVVAAFFVLLAAAQIAWAVAVARRPTVDLLKFGAALSVGVVLVWLFSRTTGLARVPGAEQVEPVGVQDSIASALEMVLAAGVGLTFTGFGARLRAASGRFASGLAVAGLGVLTAAGMAAPSGHGHNSGKGGHWSSFLAAGDHGHDEGGGEAGRGDGGHRSDGSTGGHGHAAGGPPGTGAAHVHDAAAAAHDHRAASAVDGHGGEARHRHPATASTAASAAHGHAAAGDGHDPARHHAASPHPTEGHPAPPADGAHGHEAPGHEAAPSHDAPHGNRAGGRNPHGGHENTCGGPIPGQRLSRDVQEYATYYLHVTCLEPATSP